MCVAVVMFPCRRAFGLDADLIILVSDKKHQICQKISFLNFRFSEMYLCIKNIVKYAEKREVHLFIDPFNFQLPWELSGLSSSSFWCILKFPIPGCQRGW